jgi:hypothetical protein
MSNASTEDLFASPPKPVPDVSDEGIKRDRYGRYLIPDPVTGVEKSWTRATTWAKTISDTYKLHQWQERMTAKGLTMRPDLFARIMTTEDKNELNQICEEAKNAAGAKVGANMGTALHSFTEAKDRGEEVRSMPAILKTAVDSYSSALEAQHLLPIRDFIEAVIIVPELGVAGRLDRILTNTAPVGRWEEAGHVFIGDVKTAANIGYSWLEVSIQLAIYAHAAKIWDPKNKVFRDMPKVDQHEAIVMHMPVPSAANTGYTDLYRVNIAKGWEYALLAGQIRDARKDRSLAVRLGETIMGKPVPVQVTNSRAQGIDWVARIDQATCMADLSEIWKEATTRGEWTDDLEAHGLNRAEDFRG